MKKTIIILLILTLIASIALVGCSEEESPGEENGGEETETTFERVKREGFVTVGFANEMPFAYAAEDGTLTGMNVEIARTIFKNMGIDEMVGVLTEFGSLIPGLQAGRFDVITAGMYINPDRAQEVSFANPEYTIGGGLGVRAGNPYDLHSYDDIAANPDVKIAVMAGGAEYDYLIAVGVSENQIDTVPDQPSALAALQAERVDAITMTSAALNSLIETADDPNVEMVEDFEISVVDGKAQQAFGSAAFRHEDQDFVDAYNQELQKLKDSGELIDIYLEFGFSEHQFPGDVTAEEAVEMW